MSYRLGVSVALLALSLAASSAAQTYTLEVESGAYSALNDAVEVAAGEIPSENRLEIPFWFKAFGTRFHFGPPFGFASLERAGFIFLAEGETERIWICRAFLADLDARDATSAVSYQIDGTGGNRVLKFEWKNMKLVGNPDGDFMNVQLWLYEASGDVEIRYGPHRVTGTEAMQWPGPSVGMFVANFDFDQFYYRYMLTGSPAAPSITSLTEAVRLDGVPASGTIYRFRYQDVAGVEIDRQRTIALIPNPAADVVTITLPQVAGAQDATLILYDMLGGEALVVEGVVDGATISTKGLLPGLYHAVVSSGGRRLAATKLIVH